MAVCNLKKYISTPNIAIYFKHCDINCYRVQFKKNLLTSLFVWLQMHKHIHQIHIIWCMDCTPCHFSLCGNNKYCGRKVANLQSSLWAAVSRNSLAQKANELTAMAAMFWNANWIEKKFERNTKPRRIKNEPKRSEWIKINSATLRNITLTIIPMEYLLNRIAVIQIQYFFPYIAAVCVRFRSFRNLYF